jgi:hypothetical protein
MKDKAKDMHHRNQNKHAATKHVVTPEEQILLKNDLKWDLKLFDFVQQRFVRDYARFERITSERAIKAAEEEQRQEDIASREDTEVPSQQRLYREHSEEESRVPGEDAGGLVRAATMRALLLKVCCDCHCISVSKSNWRSMTICDPPFTPHSYLLYFPEYKTYASRQLRVRSALHLDAMSPAEVADTLKIEFVKHGADRNIDMWDSSTDVTLLFEQQKQRNDMPEGDMWLSPARQHWKEQAAISSAAFGSK